MHETRWPPGQYLEMKIRVLRKVHKRYMALVRKEKKKTGMTAQREHEVFVEWRLRGNSINKLIK